METLHTLFYFIVAVGILVAFHEFGHFWVARKVGVKVLRFSIGFGKVLWSKQKDNQSTEYVLSAIPLGGYVKMVDEREGPVTSEDLPFSFNRQPLWARTAIVAAGPVFNLILAVALFWSVLVIGESGIKPILGKVEQGTLAAAAGFVEGDEIISVNDKPTPTWTQTLTTLIGAALEGEQEINVAVKNHDDMQAVKILKFSEQDAENPEVLYQRLGFKPWAPQLKSIIGQVLPDSAAQVAGLKQGDLIVSADNVVIQDWQQWVDYVKAHPGMLINLLIERDGVRLPLSITPKAVQVEQKTEGKIGASVQVPEDLIKSITVEYALSPLEALPVAFETTYDYALTTLKMMGKMLVGRRISRKPKRAYKYCSVCRAICKYGIGTFLKVHGIG